jgi:hypothetical protein
MDDGCLKLAQCGHRVPVLQIYRLDRRMICQICWRRETRNNSLFVLSRRGID